MDEDRGLIRRMKAGDKEAASIFTDKYYLDIYKYCYWKVGEKTLSEDLTQEVFVRFFTHLEQYVHQGKAKNYLYIIAGNTCKNYFRQRKEESWEEQNELVFETGFSQAENRIEICRALSRLPGEYREILILYYFQELKL